MEIENYSDNKRKLIEVIEPEKESVWLELKGGVVTVTNTAGVGVSLKYDTFVSLMACLPHLGIKEN